MSSSRSSNGLLIDNASMIYIMLGAFLAIWGGYWFVSAYQASELNGGMYFVCGGLVVAGLSLVAVGFSLGWVSHTSEVAETKFEADEASTLAAEKNQPSQPKT